MPSLQVKEKLRPWLFDLPGIGVLQLGLGINSDADAEAKGTGS